MRAAEMDELIEAHIKAEAAGDVPGYGQRISFRLLHVWEFRDGLISRENVWLDGGSIMAQLTSGEVTAS